MRAVLTYADLRSAFPDPDGRAPSRTIELHLTNAYRKLGIRSRFQLASVIGE